MIIFNLQTHTTCVGSVGLHLLPAGCIFPHCRAGASKLVSCGRNPEGSNQAFWNSPKSGRSLDFMSEDETGFSVSAYRTAFRHPLPRPLVACPVAALVIVKSHHRSSGERPSQFRMATGIRAGSASSIAQANNTSSLPRSRGTGVRPVDQVQVGLPCFRRRRLNSAFVASAIPSYFTRGSTTRIFESFAPRAKWSSRRSWLSSHPKCSEI